MAISSTKITRLKASLAYHTKALAAAQEAYISLLEGRVKSYTIGPRSLTKLDLGELEEMIEKHESAVDEIEAQLNGNSRRKAIGVVRVDS